jgi:hypothetical protein
VLEGLHGEVEAGFVGQATSRLDFGQHGAVVGRIDHDADVSVILGGRAHHGWSADVDVLDGIRQGAVRLGDSGRKRVEIHDDQINAADAVLGHHRIVLAATAKDAAVDLRVQRLHAAVHHFREAGVIGHFGDGNAVVLEQLVGAAGGQQFHAGLAEVTGKVDDAGLVGDGNQGLFDGLGHDALVSTMRGIRVGVLRGGSELFTDRHTPNKKGRSSPFF